MNKCDCYGCRFSRGEEVNETEDLLRLAKAVERLTALLERQEEERKEAARREAEMMLGQIAGWTIQAQR